MGRSPPAKIGELPKPRKQRVSTVQPLAGRPTGCDVLIYCLNHSRPSSKGLLTGAALIGAATVSTYVVRFLPKLAEFLNQRQGAAASSGMMTSSLSLRPSATTCLPST